jgi:hypothetical protein
MVDVSDRTYEFTITSDCVERIPGGFVFRDVSIDFKRREYRHTNPSKYYKLKRRKWNQNRNRK